jgi:hypothetical protein
MYMVVDERETPLSELLDERPGDDLAWQLWDTALPIPEGNYPRIVEI